MGDVRLLRVELLVQLLKHEVVLRVFVVDQLFQALWHFVAIILIEHFPSGVARLSRLMSLKWLL